MDKSKFITLWETGPFFLTVAYVKAAYRDSFADIILYPENTEEVQIYEITNEKDEKV